jgi:hypothetical protein
MHTQERRALDRWARERGWSDFDTYVATGGNMIQAARDIEHRITEMAAALRALRDFSGRAVADEDWKPADSAGPAIGPEALAAAEADVIGEPVDTQNAHVQGDDGVVWGPTHG